MFQWVLAFHIISFTAWMAGMLYLPRLFVYHAEATPGSEMSETFKKMERRLLRFIVTPAMLATWLTGIWLLTLSDFQQLREGWMHAKLTFVFMLTACHGYFARGVRLFAAGRNVRGARFWRIANEIPTILFIGIVLLAILRPF